MTKQEIETRIAKLSAELDQHEAQSVEELLGGDEQVILTFYSQYKSLVGTAGAQIKKAKASGDPRLMVNAPRLVVTSLLRVLIIRHQRELDAKRYEPETHR